MAGTVPVSAQDGAVQLRGTVVDAVGAAIPAARITSDAGRRQSVADAQGRFHLAGLPTGVVALHVSAFGYVSLDTVLAVTPAEREVRLVLRPEPFVLRPLTVRARRGEGGAGVERALFQREVVPGVVGLSRRELREVPVLAEADVMRSLQALPGVVARNDLSADLHVRGGAPDQNLILLDGARIYAPHHLFGIFSTVNSDAIGRAEFYRGALPARFGGALSSVIDLQSREPDPAAPWAAEAGLSLLGARLTTTGALPWAQARWLVAARRSHLDLLAPLTGGRDFPYALHDVQGALSLEPAADHTLRASLFGSADRFRMFLGHSDGDLGSRWQNQAGSLRWGWAIDGSWTLETTLWGSAYTGDLQVGDGSAAPVTTSQVRAGGLRLEASRQGEAAGLRAGVEVEGGRVALTGDQAPGSYFVGESADRYALPALYIETEHWLGKLRLAPGLRLAYDGRGAGVLAEPRLAARWHLSDELTVNVGASRAYQALSTLRDDRHNLPGAPLWLLHPRGAPLSRTDGASAAIEGWRGHAWSYSASVYGRRFGDVVRWRPVGARDLATLAFDDGHALGAEFFLRRHAGRATGWIGYGFGRVRLQEAEHGLVYDAAWDRRHALDVALFVRAWERLSLSGRFTYGTGLPFWPLVGELDLPRLDPLRGRTDPGDAVPVWGDTQQRYPGHLRLDVGLRYPFRLRGAEVEPFLSVQNLTGRRNVAYYRLGNELFGGYEGVPWLVPEGALPFTIFPSLGIDVRF